MKNMMIIKGEDRVGIIDRGVRDVAVCLFFSGRVDDHAGFVYVDLDGCFVEVAGWTGADTHFYCLFWHGLGRSLLWSWAVGLVGDRSGVGAKKRARLVL